MQFQTTPLTSQPPPCFGLQWSPTDAECSGGLDPQYTHPRTGSHVRERCMYYSTCGSKTQATKLLPPAQLMRPQPQFGPMGFPPPSPSQQLQISQAASDFMRRYGQAQPMIPAPVMQPQQGFVPQSYGMPVPYQSMVPMSSQMPAYLSVLEPRTEDASLWSILSREMTRSLLKSLGHTIAHFFDTTPFRRS